MSFKKFSTDENARKDADSGQKPTVEPDKQAAAAPQDKDTTKSSEPEKS